MKCIDHYFDWAATAPADKDIHEEALRFSLENWANPSSIHGAGTEARNALESCRKRCADVLGVQSKQLCFSSGGTESDHIPLLSVLTRPQKGSIVLSAIEHPALREMAKMLANCGWKVIAVSPGKDGRVRAEDICAKVQDDTVFVSVMAVNNETGAIQPIYEIADALVSLAQGKRRPFFHVDCVQAAGKIPLQLNYRGIDSASLSAHKLGGARGIGLLYLARETVPFLRGGGQEGGMRSGTENLFGACSMALCLEKYYLAAGRAAQTERYETQRKATAAFIKQLQSIHGCTLIPHCRNDEATEGNFSPWVVQAAFPGIPGQVLERALSADGYYISTGSACSAGHHARPVLDSMNIPPKEKESAVRFSFGWGTSPQAMDDLAEELRKVTGAFGF